jgi:hypothetical protein
MTNVEEESMICGYVPGFVIPDQETVGDDCGESPQSARGSRAFSRSDFSLGLVRVT